MVANYDSDFSNLLSLLVEVVDSRNGMPIISGMEWQDDCHVLAKQLVLHLHTVRSVAAGTNVHVEGVFVPFVDHGSVKVLARAAFENFIVLSFLLGPSDELVSRFRHAMWRFAGLMDRQKRKSITEEGNEKLCLEKKMIDALRDEITSDPEFAKLTEKQQKAFLDKGGWRLGGHWHELAVEAGLHQRYFKNIYSYLSDYSHSSYAAAIQVRQAVCLDEQRMLAGAVLGALKMLMSHAIHLFARRVDAAQMVLAASQFDALASRWYFTTDLLDSIYGDQAEDSSKPSQ